MSLKLKIKTALAPLSRRWDGVMTVSSLVLVAALLNPAPPVPRFQDQPPAPWVLWVENQGRFLNTGLQVALPLITRDLAGGISLVWVAVVGTSATHGLKRALNDLEVGGVRLGQRPKDPESRYNFPSGHSSLSSSGAAFVARRYSLKWLWLLVPMTLATMFARVALDDHTWTATLAGAALGVLFTWPFCAPKNRGPSA